MEKREKLGTRAHLGAGILTAHVDWCAKNLGEVARRRLEALVPPEAARYLRGPAERWCPLGVIVAVDRAIAQASGQPAERVYHELGRHSAVFHWTAPYRAFEGHAPHEFFEKTTLWHDVFQNFGTASYERVGLHAGHFTIEASDEYSPVFCASALGYFEGALQMMGAPGPFDGEETLCQCHGDPACVFVLHW